ncbi:peroxidase 5-like [Zingiber officinale]|uniref:peroxidase 5-like n=1 Tax=Zingiber officinale TaxID=94328 RepID=UPI001C4D47BD|nr:peroxidase 5-like [Zingiber officinale]
MALARGSLMLLSLVVVLCMSVAGSASEFKVGYYWESCPKAEDIVKEELYNAFKANAGIGADLLRLHFHDCFVSGCEASILVDSTQGNIAEKDAPPNKTFEDEVFDVIDSIKARLEVACKGTVSCADIIAFAARDSVVQYGGKYYNVPSGRKDGMVSIANETVDLPPPTLNLNQLTAMFASKGLSQDDLVILSGAHTIGVAHCPSFADRLYNYSGTLKGDPNLDVEYAKQLKHECPQGNTVNEVDMDPQSPLTFDSSFYEDVATNRGLFTSDQTLMSTSTTAYKVSQYAKYPEFFKKAFAASMVKMGQIGVLTGKQGTVRANCRVIN